MHRFILAALVLHTVATHATMRGQLPLERIVGPAPDGADVIVRHYGPVSDPGWVGDLSRAAGVPMGIEVSTVSPRELPAPLKLTGLTVEGALRQLHERDPRYEWRDEGGVIVLHPAESSQDGWSPLQLPAGAVRAERVTMRHALALVCGLLGAPPESHQTFSDALPFSLDFAGGRVVDLLNAIVREHGALSWVFSRVSRPTEVSAFVVGFAESTQGQGGGCGVPGVLSPVATDAFLRGLSTASPPRILTDRVVGLLPYKRRLTAMTGSMPVDGLFRATLVPFGFERGPAPSASCGAAGFHCENAASADLSGQTLGKALDTLVSLTPGYEWRETNGIIVVRPASAWSNPEHPLYKPFAGVKLDNVPMDDAVRMLAAAIGTAGRARLGDSKRLSLDVPQGTILDVMNAIVIAHGELMWEFAPVRVRDGVVGARYVINFFGPGGVQVAAVLVP